MLADFESFGGDFFEIIRWLEFSFCFLLHIDLLGHVLEQEDDGDDDGDGDEGDETEMVFEFISGK